MIFISNNIVKRLADVETGEVIEIHEGDIIKIISEKQRNAVEKSIKNKELNENMKEWNKELGGFVFILFEYGDVIFSQSPELIQEDITKLFYLSTFVDYEGNLIHNDNLIIRKDMQKLINISREKFSIFFNKLKNLGIILEENKFIKLNKEYFFKGEIDKSIKSKYNYTRLYVNSIRYLYENVSIRKHKQLGSYFKMIPYIHRQQNTLCLNPESHINDIELMNVIELKNILGYHQNSIKRFMDDLTSIQLDNGYSILAFISHNKDKEQSYIIVNPRVYYGGNFDIEGGVSGILKWFKNKNKSKIKQTI